MTPLFAQIREDAEVERATFARSRRILTIASGGCVALSLLSDDVDQVVAVDASPAQITLVAAKCDAIAALELDDFLALAGETAATPAERRALWTTVNSDVDLPLSWLDQGLLHCGSNEAFYRFVGANLRQTILPQQAWQALLAARSLDERQGWLDRYTDPALFPMWHHGVHVLLSRASHEHFFGALPFKQLAHDAFGHLFVERFRAELLAGPVGDNPFLHQLLFGRYGASKPHYLTPQGYAQTRANLHKLQLVNAPLEALGHHPSARAGQFDGISVSNVFDWATDDAREAIADVIRQLAAPDAQLVLRQMLDTRPLPLTPLVPTFSTPRDRAMLYRSVTAGRRLTAAIPQREVA